MAIEVEAVATARLADAPSRTRVLVVDDEPLIGRVLARLLAPLADVVAETRGEDALLRVRRGETFDVIFLDVRMPEMDGPTVYAELLRLAPHLATHVIYLTGDPRDRALTAGVAVLPKPFEPAAVCALVWARAQQG